MTTTTTTENQAHWRRVYLARLHHERAALLWQLADLAPADMAEPVFADWSALELLPHIGAWDSLYAERMRLVMAGQAEAIQPVDLEQRNADWRATWQSYDLPQAVARMQADRDDFLAALAQVPNEELHRKRQFPWSSESDDLATWCRWRWRHDRAHRLDLARWRERSLGERTRPAVGHPAILAAIAQVGRAEFAALVNLFSESERISRPVDGQWMLKDVVGHLTDWEQFGVDGLAQGQSPDWPYPSIQAWNEAHAEVRQAQSWEQVWADFSASRQALSQQLAGLTLEQLAAPFTSPFDPNSTYYSWSIIWLEHEHEHAQALWAVLQLTEADS